MIGLLTSDKDLVGPWVFAKVGGVWGPEGRSAIGVLSPDAGLIGGLVFENYTGRCVTVHIALDEGGFSAKRLIAAGAEYAFDQLGVEKMLALIKSSNLKSIKLVGKIGFTLETVVKDVFDDGDMLVMKMVRDECKYYPRRKEA